MRLMHNVHDCHASRETTPSPSGPLYYVRLDRRGQSDTAAASRLLLNEPAASRALLCTGTTFQDDLLVRSPHGFKLTCAKAGDPRVA